MTFWSKDDVVTESKLSLPDHIDSIVKKLNLTSEQSDILATELSDALTPVAMTASLPVHGRGVERVMLLVEALQKSF